MAISERQMAAFKKLGYSDEQIEEMIEDDKAVDRNEPLPWDMSKDEHKKAMKYANVTDKKPKTEEKTPKKGGTAYNFDTSQRKRKENPTKATIIAEISQFLIENGYENVVITNKERQISFNADGNSYEFTLVQKRKPKN